MTRLTLLALLLFAGCVRVPVVPVPPKPDVDIVAAATIDGLTDSFNGKLRHAYRDGAKKLRAGEWKTAAEYVKGQTALIDDAFDGAAQPLADREQAATNGWTPAKEATYLDTIASEGRP